MYIWVLVLIHVCLIVCGKPFFGSPWIAVGECKCTHTLHGEILYPTTPSAAQDASAGVSVGVPQIAPRLVYLFVQE